jgi:threonine dehydratase
MPFDPATPPSFAAIEAAASRLAGLAVRTPLLEAPLLSRQLGRPVYVKPETLQRTGSFKFRGAYNRLSLIPQAQRAAGVVALSSGNHAQGVALAAQMLGMPAVIIMPSDAPATKIDGTRALGASVVLYDRRNDDRDALGAGLARERGATLVHPFDDAGVIAGQGTVGLEIAEDCLRLGLRPDAVVTCCGGGGLATGIALALEAKLPGVALYTAEPAGFDDMARSLAAGHSHNNAPDAASFCDAILTPRPGVITLPVLMRLGVRGVAVSDAEVAVGMRAAFTHFKLVTEPGGCVALSAVLANRLPAGTGPLVCVLSGGNVDPAVFAAVLSPANQ